MSTELKDQLTAAMKAAMKAKDKDRLGTIRLVLSEFKQIEVDERIEVDDVRALTVLDKMLKQRRDSISQFQNAGRTDLAEKELSEVAVIQEFLPTPLTQSEISQLISDAVAESGASSAQDMGKVMAILKPKMQGRAEMGSVSQLVKKALTSQKAWYLQASRNPYNNLDDSGFLCFQPHTTKHQQRAIHLERPDTPTFP